METVIQLKQAISKCEICKDHLPLGPRPVCSFSSTAKVLVVGQAPGTKVHESGIPWDDKSGERLREWMNVSPKEFYDTSKFAIVPMGFCYPGRGKSGDNPPRKECAPLWHEKIIQQLPELKVIMLIGKYAQDYYIKETKKRTLTSTVEHFEEYLPKYMVLPHPSPRNNIWLKRNDWFEKYVVPKMRSELGKVISR